ncbi:8068_t:CDS:2 [Dentiscutata erythropus]|uniref:8068_t:CDS:1 n=1 Tax=Dentiscutata erythropus TaxID=1348616 RepID=A0A9N8VQN2_9GLOM|nr:8068_t:CDS:2 [Dentiscutata erythropus]
MLFGNSDNLMVKCSFNLQPEISQASYWKFNARCLINNSIKKDIEEELQEQVLVNTWDLRKNRIQARICQYKPPSSPERKICRKNTEATEKEELKVVIDKLQDDLQKELTLMAEKWLIRSNSR